MKNISRFSVLSNNAGNIRIMRHIFDQTGLIILGSTIFAIGMNGILVPYKIFGGGIAGIAIILNQNFFSSLDVGFAYFLLNLPLLILGWVCINREFVFYTIFGTTVFSLLVGIIQIQPIVFQNDYQAILFAGLICGFGGGLILKSVGSIGGLDVLAVYTNKKYNVPIGTASFVINSIVILASAYLYGPRISVYSIVYLFIYSQVVNFTTSRLNLRSANIHRLQPN